MSRPLISMGRLLISQCSYIISMLLPLLFKYQIIASPCHKFEASMTDMQVFRCSFLVKAIYTRIII
jgi:hypothetical protein